MKKKWILVSITVAAVLAYWLLFSGISADELDAFIRGFGPWAPLAYVAAFTVLPAFFFPVAVLALAGGLLFGFWAGAAYTFLGAANYVKHDGSRPMNITWKLERPIPAKFLKKTNKLVVG